MADYDDDGGGSAAVTVPCGICGRSFFPDALRRHEPICAKSQAKKRKVFDSGKQRSQGTDIPISKVNHSGKPIKREAPSKNNWRAKHEDFINAIRSAKGVDIALKTGAPLPPPPKPSINPDYVQCMYCNRRFNETAAERHITFCKEQSERLSKRPVVNANEKAKFDARKKYKAPLPSKKTQDTSPNGSRPPPAGRTGSAVRSAGSVRSASSQKHGQTSSPAGGFGAGGGAYGPGGYGSKNMKKSTSTGTMATDSYGRPMRTGRNPQVYEAAKKDMYGGSGAGMGSNRTGSPYTPSPPSSGRGARTRHHDDQYHSTAATNNNYHSKVNGRIASAAKFCHECGTRYPVTNAKFCCECGVKRMVLDV
ncbi:zinc finger C2HC domain-containing protein 1A-like isoform X2 [Tubulanus polymorphus]|uniref:zinc finger C2HC domain-containing protein 1A-like isoform X2 n=1 Tax=Tubulanus polymorphus TaxID=672921 RepID=UPI003DA47AAE